MTEVQPVQQFRRGGGVDVEIRGDGEVACGGRAGSAACVDAELLLDEGLDAVARDEALLLRDDVGEHLRWFGSTVTEQGGVTLPR